MSGAKASLNICTAIATSGRREILSETLRFMRNQTRKPDETIVCPAGIDDCDESVPVETAEEFRILVGPRGLTRQRNRIISETKADVVVFFDDDFLPSANFLEEVEKLFLAHPDVIAATGLTLADGILGEGLDFARGARIISEAEQVLGEDRMLEVYNAYGCNMAIRLDPVRKFALRFDERLPLYGWLEDVDFSRQLAPYGRIVKSLRLRGVHLGTKRAGRSPGRQLGYSQISNPFYLARKGTLAWSRAIQQAMRNISANIFGSFKPEPWVDRRGRLAGNLMAMYDLVLGKISPERVLEIR